jgi:hypothetical protein
MTKPAASPQSKPMGDAARQEMARHLRATGQQLELDLSAALPALRTPGQRERRQ